MQCGRDKNSCYICVNYLQNRIYCTLGMDLYLFNPETDLALASHGANYTASEKIRQMAHDLAVLPLWYAPQGSGIWVPDEESAHFVEKLCSQLGTFFFTVRKKNVHSEEIKKVQPWGWDKAVRNRLLRMGISAEILPSDLQLDEHRWLSSRERVADMLSHFKDEPYCHGSAANLYTLEDCEHYALAAKEGVVFKSPWSSSGKGLSWCRDGFTERHRNWCQRILKEQGVVTAQSIKQRVCDFAMEFHCDEEKHWSFIGYSLFQTNAQGAYLGNLLLTDEEIEQRLSAYVPLQHLRRVREILLHQLESFDYQGYMGIDMMICAESNDAFSIHPCVEMNWRMNMGVVSHLLREKVLHPEAHATFHVDNYPHREAFETQFLPRLEEHPCQWEGQRLMKGLFPLTPITPQTLSVAYISAT